MLTLQGESLDIEGFPDPGVGCENLDRLSGIGVGHSACTEGDQGSVQHQGDEKAEGGGALDDHARVLGIVVRRRSGG
jgi:hypothetical protein